MVARRRRLQRGARGVPRQGDAAVHRAVGRQRGRSTPSRGVMGVMDKRKAWQNKLNEGRWAAILWPEEWGGRAATTAQQVIYTQVMAKYRSHRHLQRQRHRADRPVDHRVGHRGAEGALAARHPRRDASTGARASRNRRPAPTSRTCAPPRSSPTTDRTTSSTVRRSGSRRRRSRSGDCSSCAPTRPRSRAARKHEGITDVHRRHGAPRHRHPPDPRDHRRLVVLRGVLRPT